MHRNRIIHLLFFTIFLFSSILRFSLALVNREANDDHLEVIRMIMQEKRLPGMEECLECFQPKLFHYLIANICEAGNISASNVTTQTILTQLINTFMGIVLTLIIWIFLRPISAQNPWLAVIAFSLAAFNPSLIGINAQATNDTLAILLGTLGIYFAWLYLKREQARYLLACILFTSLGIATKTNIFIVAFAVLFALFIKAFTRKQKGMLYAAALFLPIILVLSFLNPTTQYLTNFQRYGSVVGMNLQKQPFPGLFQKSYVARPGIISIQDGIFTFKYGNLLEYPRLTNGVQNYPRHRTSLWTQIYGRAHSVHFDNWPNSWGTEGDENFWLTRTIFVVALVPTIMLLSGAGIRGIEFLVALKRPSPDTLNAADYGLFDILFWGYIAFIIVYSLQFRDFSVMKAIFIYPALLSFPLMFIKSGSRIHTLLKKNKCFPRLLSSLAAFLMVLYGLDIYTLIMHLYSQLS